MEVTVHVGKINQAVRYIELWSSLCVVCVRIDVVSFIYVKKIKKSRYIFILFEYCFTILDYDLLLLLVRHLTMVILRLFFVYVNVQTCIFFKVKNKNNTYNGMGHV